MSVTRWGIVGTGRQAADFTSAILSCDASGSTRNQVVAVSSRHLSSATEFAQRFNIPKANGPHKELAEDTEVEVAYIAVFGAFQAELIKLFLNAGKHVLCECPFTLNAKQAQEVIELAKEKKLFLQQAVQSASTPTVKRLKDELAANTIGEVRVMCINMGYDVVDLPNYKKKELGGGAWLLASDCMHMVKEVFGNEKPNKTVATGCFYPNGVDEVLSITLHFSNNRVATILCSLSTNMDNTVKIFGTKGTMEIPEPWWCPSEIHVNGQKHVYPKPQSLENVTYNYPNNEILQYEVLDVQQCLIKGELENPHMTHADTLWVKEIIDEVRKQVGVHFEADD